MTVTTEALKMSLRRNWPHSRLAAWQRCYSQTKPGPWFQRCSECRSVQCVRSTGSAVPQINHCVGQLGAGITVFVNINNKNNINHSWARLRLKKGHDWGYCWTTVWKWHSISPLNDRLLKRSNCSDLCSARWPSGRHLSIKNCLKW